MMKPGAIPPQEMVWSGLLITICDCARYLLSTLSKGKVDLLLPPSSSQVLPLLGKECVSPTPGVADSVPSHVAVFSTCVPHVRRVLGTRTIYPNARIPTPALL